MLRFFLQKVFYVSLYNKNYQSQRKPQSLGNTDMNTYQSLTKEGVQTTM